MAIGYSYLQPIPGAKGSLREEGLVEHTTAVRGTAAVSERSGGIPRRLGLEPCSHIIALPFLVPSSEFPVILFSIGDGNEKGISAAVRKEYVLGRVFCSLYKVSAPVGRRVKAAKCQCCRCQTHRWVSREEKCAANAIPNSCIAPWRGERATLKRESSRAALQPASAKVTKSLERESDTADSALRYTSSRVSKFRERLALLPASGACKCGSRVRGQIVMVEQAKKEPPTHAQALPEHGVRTK